MLHYKLFWGLLLVVFGFSSGMMIIAQDPNNLRAVTLEKISYQSSSATLLNAGNNPSCGS